MKTNKRNEIIRTDQTTRQMRTPQLVTYYLTLITKDLSSLFHSSCKSSRFFTDTIWLWDFTSFVSTTSVYRALS